MTFSFSYDRQPTKFLKKCNKQIAERLIEKLEGSLANNPVPHNATTIVGEHGVFRIRIGDCRVIYRISHEEAKIIVIKIDKRDRVY